MSNVAKFRPSRRAQTERGGRFYETPDGKMVSVTNVLGVVGKPALLNWMATKEREYVVGAAADLYTDCPTGPKMSRLAFITSLQRRLTAEKAGDREKQKAAEIGSAVHALIESELLRDLGLSRDIPEPMSAEVAFAYSQWQEWRKLVKLEPVWVEHTVWSKMYGYAGTLDLDCKLTIPDSEEQVKKAFCLPSDLSLQAFYQKYRGTEVGATTDFKTGKRVYLEARMQVAAYGNALHEMGHGYRELGLILRLPKTPEDPPFEAVPILNMDAEFAVFLHVMELWKRQREYDIASGWIKEGA